MLAAVVKSCNFEVNIFLFFPLQMKQLPYIKQYVLEIYNKNDQ